jgi:SMI1-KNR4 cell-wall
MSITFKPLGLSESEINNAASFGLRYSKQQKRELLNAFNLQKPNDASLKRFLDQFGELPTDYISFLRMHNGGTPSKQLVIAGERELVISKFLALADDRSVYDSIENYLIVYARRIPDKTIPIACSPGGDVVLLDVAVERYGHILYWFHEQEHEVNGARYFDNTLKIAGSFSELLAALKD